jgi:hypothetical protein
MRTDVARYTEPLGVTFWSDDHPRLGSQKRFHSAGGGLAPRDEPIAVPCSDLRQSQSSGIRRRVKDALTNDGVGQESDYPRCRAKNRQVIEALGPSAD